MNDPHTEALCQAGSENRAAVLIACLDECTTIEAKRALLADWFNVCEANAPYRHELREHFAAAGWLTDEAGRDEPPDFPCTVYRAAWEDDDVETALSWTTSKETAEFFARHLVSLRAQFLGIYREDVDPWIWEATCESAFAYFNDRGEFEVVPEILSDIRPIAVLQTEGNRKRRMPTSAEMAAAIKEAT
jgi:hypothetical protein